MADYGNIKDANGETFEILEWIPRMAREYGWTSGVLDKGMAKAIEKAREDPKDPWGFQQSIVKSLLSYEAMMFCQGVRSSEEIHKGSAYEGEDINAIRHSYTK
ncbi:MAG TPA: hypothetical protein VMW09_01735 [Desulfatiglandales bacterium]|nr:hypothetical protein [Desulfatiglandales bacterium]